MVKQQLYRKYADYYDKIYSKKDYGMETEFILKVIDEYGIEGKELLDMACGTGSHAEKLVDEAFNVTGVDINEEMLNIAKSKVEDGKFLKGAMQSFTPGEEFDVVICMFTSINYNKNLEELEKTLGNFYNSLKSPGIVVFDTPLLEEHEKISMSTYSGDDLQIAQIGKWRTSDKNEDLCDANFLMLVKDEGVIDFEIDEHDLGIFSVEEIKELMEEVGFDVDVYADFTLEEFDEDEDHRAVFVGFKE